MTLFDLAARITLDTSGFEQGISKASSEMKTLEYNFDPIHAKLSKFATAAKVAFAAGAAAVTAFLKSSVDTGMQFDKTMSQVAATMGYTVDELHDKNSQAYEDYQKLRDAAIHYGETTAFTATQAGEA